MDFIKSHINDFKELRNLRVEHEKLLTAYKSLQSKLKHEKEKHEKEIAEMKIHETEYLECIKEKESIIASKEQYISELEERHEKIQDKLGEKQKEIEDLKSLLDKNDINYNTTLQLLSMTKKAKCLLLQ